MGLYEVSYSEFGTFEISTKLFGGVVGLKGFTFKFYAFYFQFFFDISLNIKFYAFQFSVVCGFTVLFLVFQNGFLKINWKILGKDF